MVRVIHSRGRLLGRAAAAFAVLAFPLLLGNVLGAGSFLVLGELALFAYTALGFLALNAAAVWLGWKLLTRDWWADADDDED